MEINLNIKTKINIGDLFYTVYFAYPDENDEDFKEYEEYNSDENRDSDVLKMYANKTPHVLTNIRITYENNHKTYRGETKKVTKIEYFGNQKSNPNIYSAIELESECFKTLDEAEAYAKWYNENN